MNLLNKLLVVVTASVLSVASFAEGKIAVVDPQAAMISTNVGKARSEKFAKSSDVVTTKAKLDSISAEMKALEASFQKEGQTWSAEKKEENDKKYQSLNQDLQFNVKKIQTAQQEARQQLMQELGPKFQAALKQVIETEKLGLVLNPEVLYYASPEYDITMKVADLINKMPDQPAASSVKK